MKLWWCMLQASMACLLPCSQSAASSQQCIAAAAGLLQDALRTTLGLPQPRLLNLMQVCDTAACDTSHSALKTCAFLGKPPGKSFSAVFR